MREAWETHVLSGNVLSFIGHHINPLSFCLSIRFNWRHSHKLHHMAIIYILFPLQYIFDFVVVDLLQMCLEKVFFYQTFDKSHWLNITQIFGGIFDNHLNCDFLLQNFQWNCDSKVCCWSWHIRNLYLIFSFQNLGIYSISVLEPFFLQTLPNLQPRIKPNLAT